MNWSIRWKLIDLIRWKPIDSKNRINVKKLLDLKVSDFNFFKVLRKVFSYNFKQFIWSSFFVLATLVFNSTATEVTSLIVRSASGHDQKC